MVTYRDSIRSGSPPGRAIADNQLLPIYISTQLDSCQVI